MTISLSEPTIFFENDTAKVQSPIPYVNLYVYDGDQRIVVQLTERDLMDFQIVVRSRLKALRRKGRFWQ